MLPPARTPSSSWPHFSERLSNGGQNLEFVHDHMLQPRQQQSQLVTFVNGGADRQKRFEGSTDEGGNPQSNVHTNSPSLLPLPSVLSAPNLRPFVTSQAQQGNKKPLSISMSTSALVSARLHVTGGDSSKFMKKFEALGTQASTSELLPAANNFYGDNNKSPTSRIRQVQDSGSIQSLSTCLTVVGDTTASASAPLANAAVNCVAVLDLENIRSAFTKQVSRLFYGCSVALELFNGHLMVVDCPDGKVRVRSFEKLQTPRVQGHKNRFILTLVKLEDVTNSDAIHYGDSVWLQLSNGTGEFSWEQGGVLGAKVREAPQFKALGLLDNESIRNDAQAPAVVGFPVPVTAYLPKSRDDVDLQVDDAQSRTGNKIAKMLGKWTIRSAVCLHRNQNDSFVYNNDEVYFEQDWFYLGADSDVDLAVLRQLPPAIAKIDSKPGEYLVERRGAWKIRLLDLNGEGTGLSLAQQQMERLLLRAKAQLTQSERMRAGQTKSYGPHLRGGTGFTAQLRALVAASTRQLESRCADQQEIRLKQIKHHMSSKALKMKKALGLEDAADLTRTFSSRLNVSASAAYIGQDHGLVAVKRQVQKSESRDSASMNCNRLDNRWPVLDKSGANYLKHSFVSKSSVASCGLCHPTSSSCNLCCQIRGVIQTLEQEHHDEVKARQNSSDIDSFLQSRRANDSRVGRSGDTLTKREIDAVEYSNSLEGPERHRAANSTAPLNVSLTDAHDLDGQSFQLFVKEDEALINLIKYKEKRNACAPHGNSQDATALSPLAARFRDRFKHLGLFVQTHEQLQQVQQNRPPQKLSNSVPTVECPDAITQRSEF